MGKSCGAVRPGADRLSYSSMRKEGVNVVAIYSHMSEEPPRFLFLHYWGRSKAEDLAQALKRTLAAQSAK